MSSRILEFKYISSPSPLDMLIIFNVFLTDDDDDGDDFLFIKLIILLHNLANSSNILVMFNII